MMGWIKDEQKNYIRTMSLINSTSTNFNGHRYRYSPNIPPSLNGSHSLFLVDYKIYIEYIYYKQFLNLMKKYRFFLSVNQSLMHVHARADVNFGNAII